MLFINLKGAFDHMSRGKLITQMIEFSINGDLITQIKSFFTNRKIQLIIDGHDNKKKEIEI